MLSAVQPDSGRYESLQNYILGGRKRAAPPAAVPTGRVSEPRLPNQPTQQPSSGLRPLPTSSQRPWQPTNQRVPYPRLMHSTTSMHSGRPTEHDIGAGDVVFVYRNSVAPGSAPNQLCGVASLPMMNHTLSTALLPDDELSQPEYARLYVDDHHKPSAAARYAVRLDEAKQNLEKARSEVELQLAHPQNNKDGPITRYGDSFWKKVSDSHYPLGQRKPPFTKVSDIEKEVKDVEEAINQLQKKDGTEAISPPVDLHKDWRSVPAIRDFKLDGVVINVDSDDDSDVERHRDNRDARNDGLLFNVCVAGPTPCRNSRWAHQHNRDDSTNPPSSCDPTEWGSSQRSPQTIDDGCRVMDHFFVGLFATPHQKYGSGDLEYYTFQYRLFSSRQLYLLKTGGTTLGKNGDTFPLPNPGGVMGPISSELLKGIVVAWRIGTVMDDSLVRHPEKQVLLNVVVEEWSLEKLDKLFDYDENRKWSLLPEFIQSGINEASISTPAPAPAPATEPAPAPFLTLEPSVEDSDGPLRAAQSEIASARPGLIVPIAELDAFVRTVPPEYNSSTIPEIDDMFEIWKEEFKQSNDTAPPDDLVDLFRWLERVIDDASSDESLKMILQNDAVINAPNVEKAQTVASLKKSTLYDNLVDADKQFVDQCARFVDQVRVYGFLTDLWKESREENEWKLVLQE